MRKLVDNKISVMNQKEHIIFNVESWFLPIKMMEFFAFENVIRRNKLNCLQLKVQ